jgi:CRP-like cAMP-binding protein
MQSFMLTDE